MSEKKLWSRSETLQLIEKFEQNRGLWDPTLGRNSGYFKRIKKQTLLKLAAEFDTSDIEIGRKLHNLKTQFSQEYKKELQHANSHESYKSKWQYFDIMKFLEPTISVNHNSSAATDDSMNSSSSSTTNRLEAAEEELKITTPTVKRNKKTNKYSHEHPPKMSERSDDEYQIFGDYIANEIRNMHFIRYKGILKRKIQRLIIEYTELDENEYLKREGVETTSDTFISKSGSQVKDETETESMYLVINGVRHFLDSPQRQDDPLGKV